MFPYIYSPVLIRKKFSHKSHLDFCDNLINLITEYLLTGNNFLNFCIQLHDINFLSGISADNHALSCLDILRSKVDTDKL